MSFLYVLLHVLAFSCELLFFYMPPTHFLLFFIPPCYFYFYISPMHFHIFLSIIYAIVSVIFYMRKRPLRLRLLFLRVQHCFCFLLLLPFLILPKLRFCYLLFLPFFRYKASFLLLFLSRFSLEKAIHAASVSPRSALFLLSSLASFSPFY